MSRWASQKWNGAAFSFDVYAYSPGQSKKKKPRSNISAIALA
jgi:hypothetical protein